MNKEALRKEIYRLVDQVDTMNGLRDLKEMIQFKNKKDFWDELTEEQKKDILDGLAEADRGEVRPFKEVKKMLRKRYNL